MYTYHVVCLHVCYMHKYVGCVCICFIRTHVCVCVPVCVCVCVHLHVYVCAYMLCIYDLVPLVPSRNTLSLIWGH